MHQNQVTENRVSLHSSELKAGKLTGVVYLFEKANDVTINENEKIILTSLEYFGKLSNLLKNTKTRILANYLAWRTVKSSISLFNININLIFR